MQDENYIVIQGWMRNRLHLKGQQLLVYALIYGFSQDGNQKFTGSLSYIIEAVGGSKPTVKKALDELVEKELLIKEEEYKNNVKFVTYYARNFTRGSKETCMGGSKETLPNNTNSNKLFNNIKENIIKEYNFSPKVNESIKNWLQYKKEKNQSYKQTGLKTLLNKLKKEIEENGEEFVIEEIEHSICQNYSGIYSASNYKKTKFEQPKREYKNDWDNTDTSIF